MDEGYILSNKYRKIIFDAFASGETDIEGIAKKHRIIRAVAQRILREFLDTGILEQNGNTYRFTPAGEKLVTTMKK